MSDSFLKMYSQLNNPSDRRNQRLSVAQERRSGEDRRGITRLSIDTGIKQDVNSLQNTFSSIQPKADEFIKQVQQYDNVTNGDRQDHKKDVAVFGLSSIPYFRRLTNVNDAMQAHDYLKAAGKGAIMLANVPEDTRDVSNAVRHLKGIKSEVPHSYQTPFSFFRGTIFDRPLKRMIDSKNETLQNIGDKLFKIDKTFDTTKLGKKIIKALGSKDEWDFKETSRPDIYGNPIKAIKYKGKFPAEFAGKVFLRIPVITFGLFMAFEIPAIVRAFTVKDSKHSRIENGFKQIAKSIINASALTLGGAVVGAAGSYINAAGSLVGIGAGSYLGSKAANWIDDKIDKI